MADVAHSDLTGSDLHEPKGVAAANADEVYIADGLGSGAWTPITDFIIDNFSNSFAQFIDLKATGTDGGTFTSGSWQDRTINTTVINDIPGASLATNTLTLPAGTYLFLITAPANEVGRHQIKLRNTSDSTDDLVGSSENAPSGTSHSEITGLLTIAAPKNFKVQHRCQTTKATNGFGIAADFGLSEVYTDVKVWKVL